MIHPRALVPLTVVIVGLLNSSAFAAERFQHCQTNWCNSFIKSTWNREPTAAVSITGYNNNPTNRHFITRLSVRQSEVGYAVDNINQILAESCVQGRQLVETDFNFETMGYCRPGF